MAHNVQLGMVFVVSAAFSNTAALVCSKMVANAELPFWSIVGMGESLCLIMFGASIAWSRPPLPRHSQAAWVLVRATFRTFVFVSAIVALKVGATPGDIAALTSINAVVAAVMGHYFLSEKLRLIHVSALVCTIAGAVLITQPAFVFGRDSGTSPYFGYVLAISSGFVKAGDFIAARKSPEVSSSIGSFLATLGVLICYVGLAVSNNEPNMFGALLGELWMLAAWVLVVFIISFIAIATSTVASVMCPAAVSATLYTGSSIVFGYTSQALIFDLAPGPFTLLGAALILIAVSIMSATRVQPNKLTADHSLDDGSLGAIGSSVSTIAAASATRPASSSPEVSAARAANAADMVEEDEIESIASIVSFMATEFAAVMPDFENDTVRLRRPAGHGDAKGAQTIGVIAALAAASV